jgi:hypothetical protein
MLFAVKVHGMRLVSPLQKPSVQIAPFPPRMLLVVRLALRWVVKTWTVRLLYVRPMTIAAAQDGTRCV